MSASPRWDSTGLERFAYLVLIGLAVLLGVGTCLAFYPAAFPQYTEPFAELLAAPGIATSALISLTAGLVTPAISLATVFLFLAATQGNRFGRWLSQLAAPVLAIPHAAAAFGIVLLLSPTGVVSRGLAGLLRWQTPPDVLFPNDALGLAYILGLTIKEIPFLLFVALSLIPSLDSPRRIALARSLGYSPVLAWLLVVAPALYRLIRLPLFAVIVFASSAIDVALILGPSLPPTLGVRLLEWFSTPALGARELAAAAAALQLAVTLTALTLWLLLEKLVTLLYHHLGARGFQNRLTQVAEAGLRILGLGLLPLGLLVSFGGLATLALASVAAGWRYPALLPLQLTGESWAQALQTLSAPLANALLIAIASVVLAVLITVLLLETLSQRRWFARYATALLSLPLLIPQLIFLSGLVLLLEKIGKQPAVAPVIAGHCFYVLPYVFLTLRTAYLELDSRWMNLATTLGASKARRFFKVRLPLLSSALLTSTMLGAAISLSLYLPTQLLGAGRVPTITTEAIALVSSGERAAIGTWAILQAVVPLFFYALALSLPHFLWAQRKGMRKGL